MKCTLTQQLTHLCILLLTCNALSSKLHQNAYAVVSAHGGGFSASVGNGNAGVSIGDSGNASQGGDDGAFSQGGGGSGLEAGISGSGGGDGPKLWLHLRRRGRRGGRSRGNDSSEDGGSQNDGSEGGPAADTASTSGDDYSSSGADSSSSSGPDSSSSSGPDSSSSGPGGESSVGSDSSAGGSDSSSTGSERPKVTMTRIAHATVTVPPGGGDSAPEASPTDTTPSSGASSGASSDSAGAVSSAPAASGSSAGSSTSSDAASSGTAYTPTDSSTSDTSTSGMSPDDTKTLALHNTARAAVGVPPLKWSTMLVGVAEKWAKTLASESCAFKHSGGKYGENLGMGTSTMADAVNMFLGEKAYYSGGPIDASMGGSNSYGHYTQVIWRSTTSVGCYYETKCKITVCNYDPAGNMIGSTPTKGS